MNLWVRLRALGFIFIVCFGVRVASAQQPASAQDAPGTRLILLGTQGGPLFNAARAEPANLLIVNGTPYLIDAGNGVARQLALAHMPLQRIGEIFITHNHVDHNADWGMVMGLAWDYGRRDPITVHGPRGTESMLLGYLVYFAPNAANRDIEGVPPVPPSAVFRAQDINSSGPVYKDANVTVTAIENCHFHYTPAQPGYGWQQSFSFRFQAADKTVVFSGDTGACGDKLADFYKGADILVHEVISLPATEKMVAASNDPTSKRFAGIMTHMREEHTTPEEIGRVAAKAKVGMVVLSHLTPGGGAVPDSVYADGVKKYYSGPVIVGHDLQKFPPR